MEASIVNANPLLEMESHRVSTAETASVEEGCRPSPRRDAVHARPPSKRVELPRHYSSTSLQEGTPEGPPILWSIIPDELFHLEVPSARECAPDSEEVAIEPAAHEADATDASPICGRWSTRYPPTRACMPNGIVAALLLATCFMAVSALTERVFFVVENNTLCTVSATMWTVTRTEIKRGQNSTELAVAEGLFPGCSSASLSATVYVVRAAAVASAVNCLVASVLVLTDGVFVALPRYICVVPILMSCLCVAVRWIAAEQLFRVDFCGAPSLVSRGFILTASLTVNVLSVIFLPIALFVCVVWYPLHHSNVAGVAASEEDGHRMTALRDPLIVGAGLGALFAI